MLTKNETDIETYGDTIFNIFGITIGTLLCLISTVGNILIIYSIKKNQYLHTPTNVLILSLAVVELMTGLIIIPVAITVLHYKGECNSIVFTHMVLYATTFQHLLIIALDRLLMIYFPFGYYPHRTMKLTFIVIVCIWLLPIIFVIPILTEADMIDHDKCLPSNKKTYVIAESFITIFLPYVINLICYVIIVWELYHRIKAQSDGHENDIKMMQMLSVLMICVTFLLLPGPIIDLLDFDKGKKFAFCFSLLHVINSASNSFVYYYFRPGFSSTYHSLFHHYTKKTKSILHSIARKAETKLSYIDEAHSENSSCFNLLFRPFILSIKNIMLKISDITNVDENEHTRGTQFVRFEDEQSNWDEEEMDPRRRRALRNFKKIKMLIDLGFFRHHTVGISVKMSSIISEARKANYATFSMVSENEMFQESSQQSSGNGGEEDDTSKVPIVKSVKFVVDDADTMHENTPRSNDQHQSIAIPTSSQVKELTNAQNHESQSIDKNQSKSSLIVSKLKSSIINTVGKLLPTKYITDTENAESPIINHIYSYASTATPPNSHSKLSIVDSETSGK